MIAAGRLTALFGTRRVLTHRGGRICFGVRRSDLARRAVALHSARSCGFFSKRSSKLGTNTVTLTVLVLVVLGLREFSGLSASQALRSDHGEALHAFRPDPHRDRSEEGCRHHSLREERRTRSSTTWSPNTQTWATHVHYHVVDPQASPRWRGNITSPTEPAWWSPPAPTTRTWKTPASRTSPTRS